jgi:hypothetical protein
MCILQCNYIAVELVNNFLLALNRWVFFITYYYIAVELVNNFLLALNKWLFFIIYGRKLGNPAQFTAQVYSSGYQWLTSLLVR